MEVFWDLEFRDLAWRTGLIGIRYVVKNGN